MAKEINRVSFEIEHYDGDTYMGFMLSIKDDGTVEVVKESNCSLADVDGDYIFDTKNSLYRIQADEPISEDKYAEILDCYNEHQDDDEYVPSAENGDYGPSNPWDAPGMSVKDFI